MKTKTNKAARTKATKSPQKPKAAGKAKGVSKSSANNELKPKPRAEKSPDKPVTKPNKKADKIVFMALKFVKTEVKNPVIVKNARGGYRVTGISDEGKPLSSIVSKELAEQAIAQGDAKQGW